MADSSLTLWYRFARDRSLAAHIGPTLNIARTTNATFFDSNGILQTAASGVARFDHDPTTKVSLGLFIEELRTNVCLRNRDKTDAAWVKLTMTALKDEVGEDGVANSASSLLATAGNATALQTITLASAAKTGSFSLKRLIGTGDVDITIDDGVTFTTVNINSLTYTRFNVTQTLANPVIGVRLVTSGDKVAIDYSQLEDNASFPTSRIATLGSSVTRNGDVINTTDLSWYTADAPGTFYASASRPQVASAFDTIFKFTKASAGDNHIWLRIRSSSSSRYEHRFEGTADVNLNTANDTHTVGTIVRSAMGFANDDVEYFYNGTRVGTGDQSNTVPTGLLKFNVCGNEDSVDQLNGHIRELRYYNVRKDNQFLEDLSNGLISELAKGRAKMGLKNLPGLL